MSDHYDRYNGMESLFATDTNVGTKLSTNLAEVGTDCISRQAAIKGMFEHFGANSIEDVPLQQYWNPAHVIRVLEESPPVTYTKIKPLPDYARKLTPLPKDVPDINVGELISREQAIEALSELATFTDEWSEHTWMYTDDVYSTIKQLPSAQPQRMRAKWIATTALQEGQITWRDYKCSNCSHHRGKPMNFCEVCGAKMER